MRDGFLENHKSNLRFLLHLFDFRPTAGVSAPPQFNRHQWANHRMLAPHACVSMGNNKATAHLKVSDAPPLIHQTIEKVFVKCHMEAVAFDNGTFEHVLGMVRFKASPFFGGRQLPVCLKNKLTRAHRRHTTAQTQRQRAHSTQRVPQPRQ